MRNQISPSPPRSELGSKMSSEIGTLLLHDRTRSPPSPPRSEPSLSGLTLSPSDPSMQTAVMELKHFAHEHPLTLIEDIDTYQGEENFFLQYCDCCLNSISGPIFRCTICKWFVLHKSCADLPQEMNHSWHPQHPLTLEMWPGSYQCDACCKTTDSVLYHCSPCQFYLDVDCAQLAQTIEHGGHLQHPLTLQLKKASFCCDACSLRHEEEGFSYQCATCHFWVHESCALLPSSIKHTSHDCPLTLSDFFQLKALELTRFGIYCDICAKKVSRRNCVYYCAGCKYFAHVGCCTTSKRENDTSDTIAETDSPNLICLPMPDKSSSVDLANRLIEQISMGFSKVWTDLKHFSSSDQVKSYFSPESIRRLTEMKQCSSVHHLILFDAQTNESCDACCRSISTPYYNCPECHLILHKSCAKLPYAIQHPSHIHPITLKGEGCFKCKFCDYTYFRGFSFHCDRCDLYVDIRCASYPSTIRHEAHEHVLNFQQNSDSPCSACCEEDWTRICEEDWTRERSYKNLKMGGCYLDYRDWRLNFQDSTGCTFKCRTCHFNLHPECALLPKKLRHRYDKHDLILTYSPVGLRSDEYYCEICEGELNPKLWFYYCSNCDYAFHCKCIWKGCC